NVEDSLDDILLLRRACQKAAVAFDLRVIDQGARAIDYLSGAGEFSDREKNPLPRLVLLDLKMPGKAGLEILEWIKGSKSLDAVVVAMFTSSTNEEDVQSAFRLGADCYLVKPLSYEALVAFARRLDTALAESPHKLAG